MDGIDLYLDETNEILNNLRNAINEEYLQIQTQLPRICEYIKLRYNQTITPDDIYLYNVIKSRQNDDYIYIDYDMDYTPILYNPSQTIQDYCLSKDISKMTEYEEIYYTNLLHIHKFDYEKEMRQLDTTTNIHIKFKMNELLIHPNIINEYNFNTVYDDDDDDYDDDDDELLYDESDIIDDPEDEFAASKRFTCQILFDTEFIFFNKNE